MSEAAVSAKTLVYIAGRVDEISAANEREACARLADEAAESYLGVDGDRIYRNGYRAAAEEIAAAIRRGGQR